VLVARGADAGRELLPEKAEADSLGLTSSECTFGATRLSASAAHKGTFAQLRGSRPAIGERASRLVLPFIVDSSLTKLKRDPEPVLSVRVRTLEPTTTKNQASSRPVE
jgi:hypothetical protein